MDSPDTIAAAAISSGSESAWQGLFFVIVALFLGEPPKSENDVSRWSV